MEDIEAEARLIRQCEGVEAEARFLKAMLLSGGRKTPPSKTSTGAGSSKLGKRKPRHQEASDPWHGWGGLADWHEKQASASSGQHRGWNRSRSPAETASWQPGPTQGEEGKALVGKSTSRIHLEGRRVEEEKHARGEKPLLQASTTLFSRFRKL